jgi:hypothetical protein
VSLVARATADSPLEKAPTPGSITATNVRAPIGVTEWTLSNGARVVLLPTTFQQDQIVFSAVARGISVATDDELVPAQTASLSKHHGLRLLRSGDLRRFLRTRGQRQPGIRRSQDSRKLEARPKRCSSWFI